MGLETMALVATIGSTAMSAVGAIQQGNAAKAAAGYNAQVAAQNAQIQKQNAEFAGAQGEQNVAAAQAETRAKLAAIEANQGASGVRLDSGSFSDVRQSEAKLGMLNALNIRSDAARRAYGFQGDAMNYTAQAGLEKAKGKTAKTAGYLNAATTVLGGAADSFGAYDSYLNRTSTINTREMYGPTYMSN